MKEINWYSIQEAFKKGNEEYILALLGELVVIDMIKFEKRIKDGKRE